MVQWLLARYGEFLLQQRRLQWCERCGVNYVKTSNRASLCRSWETEPHKDEWAVTAAVDTQKWNWKQGWSVDFQDEALHSAVLRLRLLCWCTSSRSPLHWYQALLLLVEATHIIYIPWCKIWSDSNIIYQLWSTAEWNRIARRFS